MKKEIKNHVTIVKHINRKDDEYKNNIPSPIIVEMGKLDMSNNILAIIVNNLDTRLTVEFASA